MQRFTETVALLAKINPQSLGIATASSAWVSVENMVHIIGELHIGTMVASTTLDVKLEQAKTSGGGDAADLLVLPQITAAVGAGKSYALEVIAENLRTNEDYKYVRLTVTGAGASSASLIHGSVRGFTAAFTEVATTLYQAIQRYAPS